MRQRYRSWWSMVRLEKRRELATESKLVSDPATIALRNRKFVGGSTVVARVFNRGLDVLRINSCHKLGGFCGMEIDEV